MLRKLALILTLDSSLNLPAAEPADAMPNPTEQDVKSLFGQRLSNGGRAENLQLLAIAFDQHSRNSPTLEEQIGIPYITTAGSGYWIRLCQQEQPNPNLDTLVNNALLLIYAQEPSVTDDLRLEASTRLLTVASAHGYWPAQVWLVERQLQVWRQGGKPFSMKKGIDVLSDEVQPMYPYLSHCSQIRFAPCQLQLGFWYLQNANTRKVGLELLRAAVAVVKRDPRSASSEETWRI